jgi:hypothetical protein
MGSLHSFLARIGTMNLPHVRFVVERFSAVVVPLRRARKSALKRSTTNDSRSGCCSTIPRFMVRIKARNFFGSHCLDSTQIGAEAQSRLYGASGSIMFSLNQSIRSA